MTLQEKPPAMENVTEVVVPRLSVGAAGEAESP